jgi:hypothetical protein
MRDLVIHIDYANGYSTTGHRTVSEQGPQDSAVNMYSALLSVVQHDLDDPHWNLPSWDLGDALAHVDYVTILDLDDLRIAQFDYFPIYFSFVDARSFPNHVHFAKPNARL